jgi:hypothetical protein
MTRFTLNLALLGLMVYGAMFALVTFVRPKQHEIVIAVPAEVRFEGKPEAKPRLLKTVKEIQAHHKDLFIALENFPFDFD